MKLERNICSPDHIILIHTAELAILIISGQVVSSKLDFRLILCLGHCAKQLKRMYNTLGSLALHSKDVDPILVSGNEMLDEGVIVCASSPRTQKITTLLKMSKRNYNAL